MRDVSRQVGLTILTRSGLPRVLHRIAFSDHVSILMYHAVVAEPLAVDDWCFLDRAAFASQLTYLREHFDVIPLSTVTGRMRERSITRPTVALTFDDGFQNNFEVAFPLLKASSLPATIFLTTDLVGTDRTLWFCQLNRALSRTTRRSFDWHGRRFSTVDRAAKARTGGSLQGMLKELEPPQFEIELHSILTDLGDTPDRHVEPGSPFRMLSAAAVREMAESGLIEFGAHTCSHVLLSQVRGAELLRQIVGSLDRVAALTQHPCRMFSYPNGRACDYGSDAVNILREHGVDLAVTAITGPNQHGTPRLELRRYGVGADIDSSTFQTTVHHFFNLVRGRR